MSRAADGSCLVSRRAARRWRVEQQVAASAGEGERVWSCRLVVIYTPKRSHFDAVFFLKKKKKFNSIEPVSSLQIGQFIQFIGWTVDSGGPTLVQSKFGPIDRTGPKP